MISGLIVFFAFLTGFYFIFLKKKVIFPFIFALAVSPVFISFLLYLIFLVFPGYSYNFYRVFLLLFSLLFLFIALFVYFRDKDREKIEIDFSFVLPLAVSSVIFFNVPHFFADYDPLSYALIGKTIFKLSSLTAYPFVDIGAQRPIFSYFYHPPVLPMLYVFLYLFKLEFLMYFVGAYFYSVLIFFLFAFFKKETGILPAFFVILFVAFTPGFFELSRSNFTGSIRMLFFALSLFYISRYSLNSLPVVLSGGFALFSHSIGLLILPCLFFSQVLKDKRIDFKKHFVGFSLIVFIGGIQYLLNIYKFHALDTRSYLLAIYGSIGQHFVKYQFDERHLIGLVDRLKNGYFNFFFNFKMFVLSFWILIPLYFFSLKKHFKDRILVKLSLVFVSVYFFFHFSPLKAGIFIMTYRYVFTIFPILILGIYPVLENKKIRLLFYYAVYLNLALTFLFANPFEKKNFWYKDMKNYIAENLTKKDKVLVDHIPSFFFYNNVPGMELMDTEMKDFYKIKDVYQAMLYLKKKGFTHILMPYRPDPFAEDTAVVSIYKYPFLVKTLKTYYHCSLFEINYENLDLLKKKLVSVYKWDGKSEIPMVFYKHKKWAKGKGGYRFTGKGVYVFSENKGFAFAFARDKVWKKQSCYIGLEEGKWIEISMTGNVSNNKGIFPFTHLANENKMKDIGMRWIKDGNEYKAMFKSPYFRVYTEFLNVEDFNKMALGVNFYLTGGEVEIYRFEIKTY